VGEFIPGFEASAGAGIGATTPPIIEMLNIELNARLSEPKMKLRWAELGGATLALPAVDYGKLLTDEVEKWAKVIRIADINLE
jgi:hypothetical protein